MPSEEFIVGIALVALALGILAFLILGAFSFTSAFVQRLPGGLLSFCGVTIALIMFVFARLATPGMEHQFGYVGPIVEGAAYAVGGFLFALGYARLCWFVWRRDRRPNSDVVPGA